MTVSLRRKSWVLLVAFLAVAAFSSPAPAAIVTFSGNSVDQSGTGFGTRLTILSLHNDGSESGAVTTGDAISGNATSQSNAPTVTELAAVGITAATPTFALIFNINQTGANPSLVLDDFTLDFRNGAGGLLFQAMYTAPAAGLPLTMVDNGNGSAGWLFNVSLTAAEAASFFAVATNNIGQTILSANAITGSNDGADSFFVARSTAVPEASSLVMAALVCVGFGAFGLNRRRSRKA